MSLADDYIQETFCKDQKYSSTRLLRLEELIKKANGIMEDRKSGKYFTEDEMNAVFMKWQMDCRNAGIEL